MATKSTSYKRLYIRDIGESTTNDGIIPTPVVGWFKTAHNVGGWVLHKLEPVDTRWLQGQNIDTTNVFRTVSDNDHLNIAKFNFKKGTFAFIDNDHLMATDEIRFNKMSAYNRVYID